MNNTPLWFKDAIIYHMHIKAFFDANGDGIGDFMGLTQKLDYIQELGVTAIWLLPFYPSPQRDDGYDIANYCDVHPDYGTLDDFRAFIAEAHRRDLKVITELVVNHTSDQHPWFQAARHAPAGSPERDFYIWSDTDEKFAGTRIIFTDTESSNWAWDPIANAYYWHRFFSHQPDLNHNNPQVVAAVIKVMEFWLDMGVDGMRLDAIPYLCVREGTNNENLPETHAVLKKIRAAVDARYSDRMLLAEANQWPEDVCEYFGNGDECHMAFHFPLMPRMFMAVALEDRYPIAEIMRQTPDIPDNCQWAIFLRNHDELTLEMVTHRERDYMYQMYAYEPRMRVNIGIRRRLTPLLNNNTDLVKLMDSMLLSMPGSPIIYYGDEIGMGDNIYIGDRNGVRTPMQWSIDRNAGFSRADPQRLYLPVIMDPIYGFQAVNVEAQSRDASSLLNWTRRILAVRRQHPSFGRGTLEFIRPQNRKVLAYIRRTTSEIILCVANLSQTAQAVELELSQYKGKVPVELLGNNAFPPIGALPYFITLQAHGFFWLLLSDTVAPPAWHIERLPASELPVLVLTAGVHTLTTMPSTDRNALRTLHQLEQEVLPEFLASRRWFAGKESRITQAQLGTPTVWQNQHNTWLLALIDVHLQDLAPQQYFLPLAFTWDDEPDNGTLRTTEWTLAKIRERARVGVLVDAFANPDFALSIAQAIGQATVLPFGNGTLQFKPTLSYKTLAKKGLVPVTPLGREQSNTSLILGENLILKGYRQARSGINPDVEMTRFLTAARFKHIAALAGSVEFCNAGQPPITLAALFAFVRNQGDGWSYTLNHLDRFSAALCAHQDEQQTAPHDLFLKQMQTLGRRTGQLHAVLSQPTDDPAFTPEPITPADLHAWHSEVMTEAHTTLQALREHKSSLDATTQVAAEQLLALGDHLTQHLNPRTQNINALKTRFHGDFHLGQVLLTADDFLIIDFEGEPARPIAERRSKSSPLRDVAGMLRSFDYARAIALERALTARPEQRDKIEPAFAEWQHSASVAFLQGYRHGANKAGCLPAKPEDMQQLIHFFQLEKALYELRYELAHRPHWVGVPIAGLLTLLNSI